MPKPDLRRKLTAILSADVKGYSRLMGDNEEATVLTITTYREVIATLVQEHRGRVVDSPGDNVLAEFASVVDAVNSAVAIQEELKARNAGLSENRRMYFRIGINLGDVIQEGERIYGDGVNVAARIESVADPGGICISSSAHDQVKNKLSFGFEYLGEHTVKNIEEPVKVYRVLMGPSEDGRPIGDTKAGSRRRLKIALAAMIGLLFIAGGLLIGKYLLQVPSPPPEVSSGDKMAFPLPDKPSIAVLPFQNLSGSEEQDYFSDGITNDIITDLSKFNQLFVIASNTVFTYKGKPVKVKQVSQELGVRYILEGSVQKAGDKVRVNAQLIEGTTGHHLWAERYDRDLRDLFTLQDEIIQTIVRTLAVKISEAERRRVMRKKTGSFESYDFLLRGWHHYDSKTRTANSQARQLFKKAMELDPQYASAYVALGATYLQDAAYGWTEFQDQALQRAYDLAQKALALEEANASAHRLLGAVYVRWAQYDVAAGELKRAIELNPNDAFSYGELGAVMLYSGNTEEAIQLMETENRFNPHLGPGDLMELGLAYYLEGRYEDAIRILKRGVGQKPDFAGHYIGLAAAYAQLGRSAEARQAAAKVLHLSPFFETESYGSAFRNPADRAALVEGLRKAGLK
jgi:adenylate cyclase